MQDLLRRHIDNGLAAFQGLTLTGTIPIAQSALNELIDEALKAAMAAAPQPSAPQASGAPPDLRTLLPLVRRLEVTAESGRLIVSFEIRV